MLVTIKVELSLTQNSPASKKAVGISLEQKHICEHFMVSPYIWASSFELSKMQMCIHLSSHISQFTYLAYIAMWVHPLQVVVLSYTL